MAQDVEMSDVVVVADDQAADKLDSIADQLKTAGLAIDTIDRNNGVIEGTVLTEKLKALEKVPFVKYVRNVFNYVAESGSDGDGEEIPR